MTKKLYIKKDNHLLTLLDEEDIQDKLDEKLNIEDVPTKTSDLNNDSGFLTQHQDISGKANTSDVEDLAEQIDDIVAGDLDLTTYAKTADLATVATSGSYNDLNNKPTLSSLGGDITITKQGTPETGFAATYVLKQGNTTLSPKINIPKDQFVQSASLVTVGSTPNTLESTNNLSAGDVYIKMVVNTENTETGATTLAIPVNELVDTYNADNTTLQLNDNTFSVKNGGITLEKLSSSLQTTISNKVDKVSGKSLVSDTEITKLSHVEDYANKTTVVNDLTTGGTTSALSAEQGKSLNNNKAPTNHKSTSTNYGVSDASNYGHAMASSTTPKTLGTASVGSETGKFARGDHVHSHPSYTARTGKPTAKQSPSFGDSVTISQITSDATGHVTGATDRTITIPNSSASTNAKGLVQLDSSPTESSNNAVTSGGLYTALNNKSDTGHTHLLNDLSITDILDGTEDLNDFVTQGRYKCSATNSKTVANCPFYNIAFILDVINYNSTTPVQIIYTVTVDGILAQTWYRSKSGNWTDWKQLSGVERIYPKINPDGTGENNNLNNYINQGTYMCWNTADATTVQNTPVNTGFSLTVLPTVYSSTYCGCTQIVKTYNVNGEYNNQIWTRNYYKSGSGTETWTDWECVSYEGHTHTKLASNGALPSSATQFADYKDEGYYTCGSGNSANITDKPYTGNYSCIIENKRYDDNAIIQFVYKIPGSAIVEIYYRKWTSTDNWTAWKKIANYDEIPTKTSQLTNDGDGTNVFIKNNDTRLTNARTPTSHTHNKSDINFTAISSGNDLDSFVTNGYYSCGSTTSTSVTNKPAMFPSSGANFVLVVEQFGKQVFQTMEMISSDTANSRLYFRSKTSVGWSEWRENYSGQIAHYVATTDDPLDLNDFIEKGIFTFAKSGNADGKLSNSPIFGYALYVENQEYSAGNIIQIAKTVTTSKNNNRIFYRVYTGSTWATNGEWNEIITNNKIDTALSSTSTNPVQNNVINTALSGKANSADLATVATTGSYNDLSNKPAPTTIASGKDLNSCIEPGEYICNTTTIAKTLTHTPWGDSTSTNAVAFNMQVCKTGQVYGKVMISQIIHDYNGNNTYTRTCYGNTANDAYLTTGWTTWRAVVKGTKKTLTVNYTDGTTETINFLIE